MADFIKLGTNYYRTEAITGVEVRADGHVVVAIEGHGSFGLFGDDAQKLLANLEAFGTLDQPRTTDSFMVPKPEVKPEPEVVKPAKFKPAVEK